MRTIDTTPISAKAAVEQDKTMLFDELTARSQLQHFLVLNVSPIILSVAAVIWFPPSLSSLIMLGIFWFLTSAAVACGNHRYLSHKSFVPNRALKSLLVILGGMAGQGPPILWAAFHRRHHQCTDREGDPHSPNIFGQETRHKLRGIMHAGFAWMRRHKYPNPMIYTPDLIRDPDIFWLNKHYYKWVALAMVLPTAIEFAITGTVYGALVGFLWGWAVRQLILNTTIGYINSVLHLFGSREFDTRDQSRNQWWMTIPTLGESWHNNHHAFPGSANAGLKPWRMDIAWGLIRLGEKLGWVTDVRIPSVDRVSKKRILQGDGETQS